MADRDETGAASVSVTRAAYGQSVEDDPHPVAIRIIDLHDGPADSVAQRLADPCRMLAGQAGHAVDGQPPDRERQPQVDDLLAALADLDPQGGRRPIRGITRDPRLSLPSGAERVGGRRRLLSSELAPGEAPEDALGGLVPRQTAPPLDNVTSSGAARRIAASSIDSPPRSTAWRTSRRARSWRSVRIRRAATRSSTDDPRERFGDALASATTIGSAAAGTSWAGGCSGTATAAGGVGTATRARRPTTVRSPDIERQLSVAAPSPMRYTRLPSSRRSGPEMRMSPATVVASTRSPPVVSIRVSPLIVSIVCSAGASSDPTSRSPLVVARCSRVMRGAATSMSPETDRPSIVSSADPRSSTSPDIVSKRTARPARSRRRSPDADAKLVSPVRPSAVMSPLAGRATGGLAGGGPGSRAPLPGAPP